MLERFIILFSALLGSTAPASATDDWEAAEAEYNKSYLKVEDCFAEVSTDRVACVMQGIQVCVKSLEKRLESKGFSIPSGAALSPDEYCNYIGLERADEYLNTVYQRILSQGPSRPEDRDWNVENLRVAQRLWLQYSAAMCSEDTIVGWHAGGSGWGAVTAECATRLSIQQATNLDRYFTIEVQD